jgi:hypothetical protein
MKDATLANSLADAEILAAYAIRNNLPGIQDAVEGIAEARESFEEGKLMGEVQKRFYADFSTLASRVAPVTVSTLKSSLAVYGPGRRTWFGLGPKVECSYAQRAANFYRTLATCVLVLLLVVQSYWLVGSNLLAALPKLSLAEAGAAEARFNAEGNDPAQKPATTKEQLAARAAEETENLLNWRRDEIAQMLAKWMFLKPEPSLGSSESVLNAEHVVLLASRVLEVLQQYVLPLLYGWLGAMTYVLRILGPQARARLYSVDDQVGFNLRIWLGIVAGLAIGWFFRSDKGETTTAVGSIWALALAFVAGYSVELLFTAMDRIVTAFSGAPEGSGQRQKAPPKAAVTKDQS